LRFTEHSPGMLSREDLIRSFIGRRTELETLLTIARENTGPVNQHVLVVAARGMGKTTLAWRLAFAIEDDPELARQWYPIVAPEEHYDVRSAGELWLAVLSGVPRTRSADADRWASIYGSLREVQDESTLRAQALARLTELAEAEKKRLLVIVENLNMVIGEQVSDDAGWDIRKTLQTDPHIMLVGTATVRFEDIANAGKAMFNLFREIKLPALTQQECRELWKSVADEELHPNRIRPLQILTGGNPRLLAILAAFAAGTSFRDLMMNLCALIDRHTPYFKAQVEALPSMERRVYVTLAELWEPAGAREVARACRTAVNETSEYLKRLVERGAVTRVQKKGRGYLYQVSERLFSIYYIMRRGAQVERVRAVVEFMVRFYEPEQVAKSLALEASALDAPGRAPLVEAFRHVYTRFANDELTRHRIVQALPLEFVTLPELAALGVPAASSTGPSESERDLLDRLTAAEESYSRKEYAETLGRLDAIIARCGSSFESFVAWALVNKGATFAQLGRRAEEIEVYDEVIRRFGGREDDELAMGVAWALVNKGVAVGQLGRPAEAIEVYDEVVQRFGEREEIEVVGQVARALVNKGIALGELERPAAEVAAYDEAVRRFGERQEAELRKQVARALVNKGSAFGQSGRLVEAIEVYDEVVRRFGDSHEAILAELAAESCTSKCLSLVTMKRSPEALGTMRDFLGRPAAKQLDPARLTDLLVAVAAAGSAREWLDILENSAAGPSVEPLVVALKMVEGQEIQAPQEVVEVARDIVDRIERARVGALATQ